jgi:hypothetical protein
MWLPGPFYEALPYGYLLLGALLVAWSYYRGHNGASTIALVAGVACVVAGVVLKLRRRSFRQDTAKYDSRSLDE